MAPAADRSAREEFPMNDIARRAEATAATPDLWQSIPLECILGAVTVFLAAGLKLAGLLP
ncbi:hypothetical protein AKJ13_21985 [Methylobacterium sp. ARG-1]|nr:hypothetical protein AKJ13_21985 [Methylobacterium sp. ARG-1]